MSAIIVLLIAGVVLVPVIANRLDIAWRGHALRAAAPASAGHGAGRSEHAMVRRRGPSTRSTQMRVNCRRGGPRGARNPGKFHTRHGARTETRSRQANPGPALVGYAAAGIKSPANRAGPKDGSRWKQLGGGRER
jgi:hypothetical protein